MLQDFFSIWRLLKLVKISYDYGIATLSQIIEIFKLCVSLIIPKHTLQFQTTAV
jgi:hypothetical protein